MRKAEIRDVIEKYLAKKWILESSAISLLIGVEKSVKKDYGFELQFKQFMVHCHCTKFR